MLVQQKLTIKLSEEILRVNLDLGFANVIIDMHRKHKKKRKEKEQ